MKYRVKNVVYNDWVADETKAGADLFQTDDINAAFARKQLADSRNGSDVKEGLTIMFEVVEYGE